MVDCVVCGRPTYLTVDERALCCGHAAELVMLLEETLDRLRERHQRSLGLVDRFATMEDFIVAGRFKEQV